MALTAECESKTAGVSPARLTQLHSSTETVTIEGWWTLSRAFGQLRHMVGHILGVRLCNSILRQQAVYRHNKFVVSNDVEQEARGRKERGRVTLRMFICPRGILDGNMATVFRTLLRWDFRRRKVQQKRGHCYDRRSVVWAV